MVIQKGVGLGQGGLCPTFLSDIAKKLIGSNPYTSFRCKALTKLHVRKKGKSVTMATLVARYCQKVKLLSIKGFGM